MIACLRRVIKYIHVKNARHETAKTSRKLLFSSPSVQLHLPSLTAPIAREPPSFPFRPVDSQVLPGNQKAIDNRW